MRHDSTYFTISTGNAEYICLRHRGTQTLWISDLIVPYKYSLYGKLQIGLHIAAFEETIGRWQAEIDSRNTQTTFLPPGMHNLSASDDDASGSHAVSGKGTEAESDLTDSTGSGQGVSQGQDILQVTHL